MNKEIIIGIDEAGRGPWAGPVVAACCHADSRLLTKYKIRTEIDDSKALSEKKRDALFEIITPHFIHGIGIATSQEIDKWGIKRATQRAMQRAIDDMHSRYKIDIKQAKIDGNDRFQLTQATNNTTSTDQEPIKTQDIIKGDTKNNHIKCASIIAKVTRDRMMLEAARQFPEYKFENHKGYGTQAHQDALTKHGPCPIHRFSYKPIQAIPDKQKEK